MKTKNESIGRLVSILYRTGQSHIGKRLEPYGIGSGQFSFLAELFQLEGISQDELAAYFGATRRPPHVRCSAWKAKGMWNVNVQKMTVASNWFT